MFALLVLTLRYAVLPNIGRYQEDIVSRVATATGMDVSASAMLGGWDGLRPFIELQNVVFKQRATPLSAMLPATREALRLPRVRAALSWWSLLVGQVRFAELSLDGPELMLTRDKAGVIYFAGRPLNQTQQPDDGRLMAWLTGQPGLDISHAALVWVDEMNDAPPLRFGDVRLQVRKRGGHHLIGFAATPPIALARELELSAKLNVEEVEGHWAVAGTLFGRAMDANLDELRRYIPVPGALQSGFGNARVWVDVDSRPSPSAIASPLRAITADVHIVNARARLGEGVTPLNVAELAGRLTYKAEDGGYVLASRGLSFRTLQGVVSPPADFSLRLLNQADAAKALGEVSADGIDLKVMTSLLEYFPIGKEMRAMVARFNPRGRVKATRFVWKGPLSKPGSYQIKGGLADFAVNADGALPGVSGFTGTIEGDEKGGKFGVASSQLVFDAPKVFRAPLHFDKVNSQGAWKTGPETVEVALDHLRLENADLAVEIAGRYTRYRPMPDKPQDDKGPGAFDFTGKLLRANLGQSPSYLPNGMVKTRDYLEASIRGGELVGGDLRLKGEIRDFPYRDPKQGEFRLALNFKDVDFRYADGWPLVNEGNGEFVLERTGMKITVDSARIFNTSLKGSTLAVESFDREPPILAIDTQTEARAEEITRFLRESPLADNVGAFTRYVKLEGAGKLGLALKIPLDGKPLKLNGQYALLQGSAKPEIGPLISQLSGTLSFSENGLKSTNIKGMAYGNPLTIGIDGGGGAPVVTQFAGRANLNQLADVLPFRLPQQVSGTTDIGGRIIAKGGVEMVFESDLKGVGVNLPFPLAKPAEESRRLRFSMANVGQPSERLELALAGATLATGEEDVGSRVYARFRRRLDSSGKSQGFFGGIASIADPVGERAIAEGMWLAGSPRELNFDAWLLAINRFYPPPTVEPATPARAESPIAGFDFRLGSLLAYGRPFKAMALKGRYANGEWRMNVESPEAEGDFSWRAGAYNERGAMRARLKNFVLIDETPINGGATVNEAAAVTREIDFPALDIVADSFTFKNRWLGKVELTATPLGANWRIDRLAISNGHAKLEMDGLWQRYGDPEQPPQPGPVQSRTVVNLKFESNNLNALFNQFGYGEQVARGTGKLEGKLAWPGQATQFQLAKLSGDFKVEGRKGQFAKIPPGAAGKLLSLLSLQAIGRRFVFDFRDVFSEGFAFDTIDGDVKVKSGIMTTTDFTIVGPAASVKMEGDISLPNESQNLLLTVVPTSVDTGVLLGVGLLASPVVGLTTYVAQKLFGDPVAKALSYQLSVAGTWDNPQVERVNRNVSANAGKSAEPTQSGPKKL